MANEPLLLVLYILVWTPVIISGLKVPRFSHVMTVSAATPPSIIHHTNYYRTRWSQYNSLDVVGANDTHKNIFHYH